jgi:DHA1 family multidrug resistance protein-like MFS transporter/DHA1 family quinolone resistance protein-like MFS transporter
LGGNSFAYLIALLVTGSLLGHMEVKRATRLATAVAFAGAVATVLAVIAGGRSDDGGRALWIWSTIVAGMLGGAAMALYWPFLMSWVSARYEGLELNRRFGRYNGSWSGGGLVGPVIGALLVDIHPLWPMVASAVCFVLVFVLLGLARGDSVHAAGAPRANGPAAGQYDPHILAGFRWMSRVSLFCAWASQAIARSQFALLFVVLGYSEFQYGLYYGVFATCNFLALLAAGRWAFWHFRLSGLIGAQSMMLVALFMMLYGRALGVFFLSAIILGVGFGFAYSSHLYYGASASRNRSVRMAIHETVISVGITVGALGGGLLARHVDLHAPYWFAIVLVGAGGVAQLAIYSASRLAVRRQP